jgi:nitrite reductase (NO-forming)
MRLYQTAARVWLTLAALSLLLPEADRLGVWLPLHLALAGAISLAISGAMQNFALTLTSTPAPSAWLVLVQFALVTAGAALIALERPLGHEAGLAIGGALFLLGIALLGWIVLRAWRRAINRRHPLPMAMYGAAVAAMLVGGTLGALVGAGAVRDAETWIGLRQAHMTLNVLGWVSLTIVGTLVTLLPTVLRIRMPTWHGWVTVGMLIGGLSAIAAGLALRRGPLAGAGGVVYAAGALGVAWMAAKAMRVPRTWPIPVAAKHLLLALGWFTVGSIALGVALLRGSDAFAAFRRPYLVMFVLGWSVQTLLGAWQYLLPMARPGHPDERRRQLSAIELGASVQLLVLNGGVALLTLAAAGWAPGAVGALGAWLALGGGLLALAKAWAYPVIARVPALTRRHLDMWGA